MRCDRDEGENIIHDIPSLRNQKGERERENIEGLRDK